MNCWHIQNGRHVKYIILIWLIYVFLIYICYLILNLYVVLLFEVFQIFNLYPLLPVLSDLVFKYRRFLMGLLKYGKGDWRNISRNFVVTKTPTQVASHAQKYYIRQKVSGGKDKRRPSIHDITTVNIAESAASDKNKPQLFNVSSMIAPQQKLNSMSKLDWTSHYNDGSLMVFNPNSNDMFVSSSSDIKALKMQGQDLYDCALHEAYAKVKVPSFSMAPRDFNNEAVYGIHAL